MKKLFLILSGTLLFANLFFSTGCGDDTTDPVDVAPLVTLTLTSADTIAPGGDVVFTVEVTKGTNQLKSLSITEDGVDVDAARITIENIDVANNPQLITDADKDGLTWNVTIAGPAVEGDYTYEVSVDDEGTTSLSDSDVATVTVKEPVAPGTDITGDITGALLNQAGPAGTGGLDLDTGTGTGSSDANSELRDWGIDTSLPVDQNWIQKIGAINNSTLRVVDQSIDIFDFDAVTTVEEIADEWSKALPITDNMTDVVMVGDVFVVNNTDNGRTYLLHVDEVNVTDSDNSDNYVFSIKY